MLFSPEKSRIEISARELVAIAARGTSSFTVRDEDISASEPLIPPGRSKKITLDFSRGDIDFSLTAAYAESEDFELSLTFPVEEKPEKLKRSTEQLARGQAFVLAYMLSSLGEKSPSKLNIRYLNLQSGCFTDKEESPDAEKIMLFFEKCVDAILPFAEAEKEKAAFRLPSMKAAKFPYGELRDGQSDFIRAVYRTISRGGELFANAPTGTGKTVSALFPAIRALGNGRISKAFYLTPKTTIAEPVKECLSAFANAGVSVRAVVLSSKERSCQQGTVCRDGADCERPDPKKLRDAVFALHGEKLTTVTLSDIQRVANQYTVCPYELALGYSELCDIVVCDFNYLFDPDVCIRRYFTKRGDYAFLVDEAHNLPERAREIFSAELSTESLLMPFNSEIIGEHSPVKGASLKLTESFRSLLYPAVSGEIRESASGERHGLYKTSNPPHELYTLFDEAIEVCDTELKRNRSAKDAEAKLRSKIIKDYAYSLKRFIRCLELFDTGFEFLVIFDEKKEFNGERYLSCDNLRAKLLCLDTGRVLRDRCALGKASVFFSGTLNPIDYFRDTLGGDRSSEVLRVTSPFVPEQLKVSIVDSVSTRFNERDDTLIDVCRFISASMAPKKGHYMIFTPSYAYCKELYDTFVSKFPKIKAIIQKPGMSNKEKQDFLRSFDEENGGFLAAFCVTGGIYSEGIDLSGDKLIGAIIVGISMPTPSVEREAIAAYYDEKMEAGKLYAYIYPGLNKVLQAAGRVIRSENDRGIITLIDDRFADPLYRDAAPSLWQGMTYYSSAVSLNEDVKDFWEE